MSSGFVPLDTLLLSKVIERNTNTDGSERDPRLLARMQNPICNNCHEMYKKKYPNQPFDIRCHGIYNDIDYEQQKIQYEAANPGDQVSVDEIREIYDVVYWAEKYIVVKDDNQDLQPFKARWYQSEVLRCSANRKVDRMGRGLGKTSIGVIEEMHKAITTKNYEILVICPADSQTEKWFTEIQFQLDNSPALAGSLASRKQQPFKVFKFHNGAQISLFTAGSKSGRGADSVRSQSPRRIRLEEQDYLAEKDYDAILPLTRRYKNSEVHGASTPTGLRQTYWQWCVNNTQYREFYFPISVHPDFSPEYEMACIREAKTMDRYRHEYLAEFGDPAAGVFKSVFVDAARQIHFAGTELPYFYSNMTRNPMRKYFMGIDWNGAGTGTKIRVIEYDPVTQKRRMVDKKSVDEPGSTQMMSMAAIRDMNRQWMCEDIFIDAGYGNGQDEMIRMLGKTGDHPADARLLKVKVIDFGGTLEFNKLVLPKDNTKYTHLEENKFERRTKPFMVDNMVMALEAGLFEFSGQPQEDPVLEEQLRAYRIKTYSNHGYANTYEAPSVGDHDLDATLLAVLASSMKYGLFQTEDTIRRMAHVLRVGGWGVSTVSPHDDSILQDPKDARRQQAGIPSRSEAPKDREKWRIQYLMRGGAYMAPNKPGPNRSAPPSRTAMFRGKPRNKGPFG